jgi:AcrR family transcriptional regulator
VADRDHAAAGLSNDASARQHARLLARRDGLAFLIILSNNRPMSLTRSPGRPSKAPERSAQVISAFVHLIATHGLEAVTLDDVARVAGVDRSAIRHYVGNRQQLIWASLDLLIQRYDRASREALGDAPTADRWLEHLFGTGWGRAEDDAAFDVLVQEAIRDDELRARLHASYATLVGALAAALRREAPGVTRRDSLDVAYAIVCLAEHNLTMQSLGFARTRAAAAGRAARTLVDDLRARAEGPRR